MSSLHPEVRASDVQKAAACARGVIRGMWKRYRERHMRLRELAELAAMDDMALKDIGISRLDIRAALRSGADLSHMSNDISEIAIWNSRGEGHAKGLLDRPRLGAR